MTQSTITIGFLNKSGISEQDLNVRVWNFAQELCNNFPELSFIFTKTFDDGTSGSYTIREGAVDANIEETEDAGNVETD